MKKQYIIIPAILVILAVIIFWPSSKNLSIRYTPVNSDINLLKNATLNLYIENSGSMNGYTCKGSEFNDAIYGYASSLGSEFNKIGLYYINSQINHVTDNVVNFIDNLNPQSFKKVGGSTANTDMTNLIQNVINLTNDSTVSIFISDCILDINGDPTKYFTRMKIGVENAVKNFIKDKNNSIEIIQLESHFVGKYFGIDGITKLDEKRPYYIWILGPNELLSQMNRISPIEKIEHGVKNWISFSKLQPISFEVKNKFGQTPKDIQSFNGIYNVIINANLERLLKSEELLCNPSHFSSENKLVKIESVNPIKNNEKYSHTLTLSINKNISSCSEIINYINANTLSEWVEKSNDDTGKNIKNNITKTTGIKYLIEGVSEAYKDVQSIGKINFVIDNK